MHPTRIVNVFLFVVFVRSPRNLSRNSSTTKPRLLHLPKKRETRPETDEFIYIFCTDDNFFFPSPNHGYNSKQLQQHVESETKK
jgi:hypothetical protein